MNVNDYKTGQCLAKNVQIDEAEYMSIAQQPEGVCRADAVLSDEQIEQIAAKHPEFRASTTIFCDSAFPNQKGATE